MKKIFFIFALFTLMACKKDRSINDITENNWVLSTATITPGMLINGKLETNYRVIDRSCIGFELVISFSKDGTYAINSNAPACDYWNSSGQKYTKKGNQITTSINGVGGYVYTLDNDKLSSQNSIEINNINYVIDYVYHKRSK